MVVISDLYRRLPGMSAPSREQAQGAWAAVSTLRHESDHPLIQGAYAAAEWTLQVTDGRPLRRARLGVEDVNRVATTGDDGIVYPADQDAILAELQAVTELLGRSQDGESFARGVYVWLAWWVGVRDLPEQFIPASAAFEKLRGAA